MLHQGTPLIAQQIANFGQLPLRALAVSEYVHAVEALLPVSVSFLLDNMYFWLCTTQTQEDYYCDLLVNLVTLFKRKFGS